MIVLSHLSHFESLHGASKHMSDQWPKTVEKQSQLSVSRCFCTHNRRKLHQNSKLLSLIEFDGENLHSYRHGIRMHKVDICRYAYYMLKALAEHRRSPRSLGSLYALGDGWCRIGHQKSLRLAPPKAGCKMEMEKIGNWQFSLL